MFTKKKTYVLFGTALLFCMVMAADLRALPNGPEIKRNLLGLNSIDKMKPNGVFEVQVWQEDQWQEAGSLAYDKYFRTGTLDISRYSIGEETVKIRLIQKGGGAAHIDSVSLGGRPLEEVKGLQEVAALKKLSQKDHDVVNVSGETLELSFQASGEERTLKLVARVEGMSISATPFQFPLENLYRPMGVQSRFYKYHVNAEKGSLKIDGDLGEVLSTKPFFKEYSRTGSGHPSGFTYGWVRNDDENLYVAMDFTPDNTMDGSKDYAKVYAKTGNGLKEFKVSVPERSWGSPGFTYTDKVGYQHKVYEFKIPFSELGLKEREETQEMQLAFAAYGTASPGDHFPSIAYDPSLNRYLAVYQKVNLDAPCCHIDIFGQFLAPDGVLSGVEFPISNVEADSKDNPAIAYDSVNHRFLVVWEDQRNSDVTANDIYGQIVNADGTLSGGNFPVSDNTSTQERPSVAYDSANQRFLVVWQDGRNPYPSPYGQLVNTGGTLYDGDFSIANVNDQNPQVAYDSVNQKFLVIFNRYDGNYFDIHGQVLNPDGSPDGAITDISTGDNHKWLNWNSIPIAYDSTHQRFLVVWEDDRGADHDIYGQLLNANGTPTGGEITISNEATHQSFPTVAYDAANQRYLVAWHDSRNGNQDIYGQFVDAGGSPSGVNFVISDAADRQYFPAVAYNSNCQNFLVSYEFQVGEEYLRDVGMALVGNPCPEVDTTPDPFTFIDQTGVGLSTVAESNLITVSGIDAAAPISITGGEYSINGGSYTPLTGEVNNNDTVRVRQTSSGSYSTTTDATLTIGGVGDIFSVTTTAQVAMALTVNKAGTGGGNVAPSSGSLSWTGNTGTCSYDYSTAVTLTALADAGSFVNSWTGCLHRKGNTCDVAMDADQNVDATFTQIVFGGFNDVPTGFWADDFIYALSQAGITGGCGNGNYCPNGPMTRAMTAVFIITAMDETLSTAAYNAYFSDITDDGFAPYINRMYELGISGGCGGGKYCPAAPVTRAMMAVFIETALGVSPPASAGGVFNDVDEGTFGCDFIEDLAARGITGGCGGGNYCPNGPMTRAEMAVFLGKAFLGM